MKKPQETSFRPLLACIIMQLAMGMLYGWSVLLAPLEQSLEASRSEVSLAYSLAFIFVTIGCFVTHRLLQIMKLPSLTLLILSTGAIGVALAGFGGSIYTLIIGYGVLFGFSSGVSYFLAVSACGIKTPFPHSVALSIAVASFALGGVIWPPIYTNLIDLLGVHGALEASALVILFSGLICYYLFKSSNTEVPRNEEKIGFFEDLLTERPRIMICLWIGFLLLSFAALMIMGHAAGMAKEWGNENLSLAPTLPSLGYITGALIAGQICRFLSGRTVTVGMCLLASIAFILSWLFPGPTVGLLMLALVGVSFGFASTAYPTTIGNYYGVNAITRIYGRQSVSYGVGGLLGPLVAAAIYDMTTSYSSSIVIAAIIAILAAIIHLMLPKHNPSSIQK